MAFSPRPFKVKIVSEVTVTMEAEAAKTLADILDGCEISLTSETVGEFLGALKEAGV